MLAKDRLANHVRHMLSLCYHNCGYSNSHVNTIANVSPLCMEANYEKREAVDCDEKESEDVVHMISTLLRSSNMSLACVCKCTG